MRALITVLVVIKLNQMAVHHAVVDNQLVVQDDDIYFMDDGHLNDHKLSTEEKSFQMEYRMIFS